MTHAESQDLLLDLAYGELDAERAREVASHLEGCAECQKEKVAIEEVRRIAAPLRELEEPPAGFDDRILAAARAQAQLEHDGNVGEVIEVTGSVRPMGMEPARIDAHGPVKTRPAERRKPRWLMRAALGGSVAAAAALALVVSTSLETRRNRESAVAARSDDFRIRVEPAAPPSVSVDSALRDAEAKRERAQPEAQQTAPARPPLEPAPQKDKVAQRRVPKNLPAAGSGGDVSRAPAAATQKRAEVDRQHEELSGPVGVVAVQSPAPPVEGPPAPAVGATPLGIAAPENKRSKETANATEARDGTRSDAPPSMPVPAAAPAVKALSASELPSAGDVEARAQEARHGGDYGLAASLYRQAATLRAQGKEASAAAWNLAHAVECLSAAGRFDEARAVREELASGYPAEGGALSAARRALRESETVPTSK
ncbi:MAG TPA: zf-HC2 domain-containing protein [Myxococcales bacterium]|nr:zf-HC2 domain-containing protein [Myxococcales bacterium]